MRIAVLGLGLIGGSVALAARERLGATVAGYDPNSAALGAALDRGAIDAAATSVEEAVDDADIVFAAAPAGALPALVSAALAGAGADTIVTDVGSVKAQLGPLRDDPRFIGGHPMAGAETGGIGGARPDLFEGASWYVTKRPPARLVELIETFGATVRQVDATEHDRMVATVSHLPHVLANLLMELAPDGFEAGPSFRDATRVAGANSDIWVDIYRANAGELAAQVDTAAARLTEIATMLREADPAVIRAWNDAARERRS